MEALIKSFVSLQLFRSSTKQSIAVASVPNRFRSKTRNPNPPPKKRHPEWLPKPQHALCDQHITADNQEFIQSFIQDKYQCKSDGPLKIPTIEPSTEWTPRSRRTGLVCKKIGVYPMWLKNGKRITSTLLQVVDNHVIKYIPPEEFNPVILSKRSNVKKTFGCLLVGADSMDPQLFTKEYSGLFENAGVMPKRVLSRFMISPDAALQPGTPLFASHFKPGEVVDIKAKTIDRGFQGVMKRWGFKGMPASHGVTKTHRRPGNIGSGGTKARVMPGTKLPGHMGNRYRICRGIRILRVNTKYNVIWILGQNLPGEIGTFCHVYDTLLPLRKLKSPPHFPTYLPELVEGQKEVEVGAEAETAVTALKENLYVEDLHLFGDPSIEYGSDQ